MNVTYVTSVAVKCWFRERTKNDMAEFAITYTGSCAKKYGYNGPEKWYVYVPLRVLEGESKLKMTWNYDFQTVRVIGHRR